MNPRTSLISVLTRTDLEIKTDGHTTKPNTTHRIERNSGRRFLAENVAVRMTVSLQTQVIRQIVPNLWHSSITRHYKLPFLMIAWSGVVVVLFVSINEVNIHLARLVLRWVTVTGFNSWCGTLSRYVTIHESTHPGHPFVGTRNEYQPKGDDALQLGSKGRYGLCIHEWLVVHGPYLSTLEMGSYKVRYKLSFLPFYFFHPGKRHRDEITCK